MSIEQKTKLTGDKNTKIFLINDNCCLFLIPNTYADSNKYELYPKALGENPILVNKETGETWSLLTIHEDGNGKIKEIYWRPIPYQMKDGTKQIPTNSKNSK